MNRIVSLGVASVCALVAWPATAYIGPGAGLSLVGALWAVIAAIGAALFFVLAWPLRRMMRRRRAEQAADAAATADASPAPVRTRPHDGH